MLTERSRLQRMLMRVQNLMRRMRHLPVKEQVDNLNVLLRGHYAYFGIAGNFRALQKVYRPVEAQDALQQEMEGRHPMDDVPPEQSAISIVATKAVLPVSGAASCRYAVNRLLTSVLREICMLRSVAGRRRETVSGHPVGGCARLPYSD